MHFFLFIDLFLQWFKCNDLNSAFVVMQSYHISAFILQCKMTVVINRGYCHSNFSLYTSIVIVTLIFTIWVFYREDDLR